MCSRCSLSVPRCIIFDIDRRETDGTDLSVSGFGHPTCLNTHGANTLPAVRLSARLRRTAQPHSQLMSPGNLEAYRFEQRAAQTLLLQ